MVSYCIIFSGELHILKLVYYKLSSTVRYLEFFCYFTCTKKLYLNLCVYALLFGGGDTF